MEWNGMEWKLCHVMSCEAAELENKPFAGMPSGNQTWFAGKILQQSHSFPSQAEFCTCHGSKMLKHDSWVWIEWDLTAFSRVLSSRNGDVMMS